MEVDKTYLILGFEGQFLAIGEGKSATEAVKKSELVEDDVHSALEVSWWVSDKLDLTEGEFGFLDGFQVIVAQDLASLAAAVACMETGMANPPYSVWDHEHRRVGWVGVGSWGLV